ncbi:hypothetical protein MKW94_019878 [Papaver nudicaule]|uniref:J domain-containing protein n=1 Tax=Papaver nudicaule TaxID=74823 RepID=A0AA42AZ20_PAPNU|nr:hypothetical protein [Papaver nudicaule]
MSPTLVDFRTTPQMQSKQNPNPSKNQIPSSSSNSFDFDFTSSNNQFSKENQSLNRNVNQGASFFDPSFTSPSVSRNNGSEKPFMGTSTPSGLSKPRLVKVRKHLGTRSSKKDSGFRTAAFADTLNDQWVSWNPFASNNSAQKTGLGESVGNSLPDEMTKLNIGRGTNEGVNLNSGTANLKNSLPDEMTKLNIGRGTKEGVRFNSGKHEDGSFVSGTANLRNSGFNMKTCGLREKIDKSLPHEMTKLNIGIETNGSGANLGTSDMSKKHVFVFGSGSKKGAGLDENKVSNDFGKLNIDGIDNVDSKTDTNFHSKVDDKKSFSFKKCNGIPDAFCQNQKLPDEMEKLNIDDCGNAGAEEKAKEADVGFQGLQSKCSGPSCEASKQGETFASSSSFSTETSAHDFRSVGSTFEAPSMERSQKNVNFDFSCSEDASGTSSFRGFKQDNSSSFAGSHIPHVSSYSFSPATPGLFQSAGSSFEVPSKSGADKKANFIFTSSQDGFETPQFRAPKLDNSGSSMGDLASAFDKKLDFAAQKSTKDSRLKRKKGKLKPNTPVRQWVRKENFSTERCSQEKPDSPGSCSPMDFSPYQETLADDQPPKEASVTSDEPFRFDPASASADAHPSVSVDATGKLKISSDELKQGELNDGSTQSSERREGASYAAEGFVFGAESEYPRFTGVKLDTDIDVNATIKTEANIGSNMGQKAHNTSSQFCFASSSDSVSYPSFTFGASPSPQGSLSGPARHCRKKDRRKVGQGSHPNAKIHLASLNTPLFTFADSTSQSVPGCDKTEDSSVSESRGNHWFETDKEPEVKEVTNPGAAVTDTVLEACEKWRVRGNQAYAKGNLSRAEGYYTRGLNCVSRKEASKSCLKALVLCYSNRAAARMTLGRMREALGDCNEAIAIDPNFYKAQLRAANCHLALGEVDDALRYFRSCAQSGGECLDRKVVSEASDGLRIAQKVAGYFNHCVEVLQQRKFGDAEKALTMVIQAESICPKSEKLAEIKAETLFMLRRYEDVLQLCEQSLGSLLSNAAGQSDNSNPHGSLKGSRAWCWSLISKSYFYLGRLEEAVAFLDKIEQGGYVIEKHEGNNLKSSASLSMTIHELLRHKAAGNEAFQSGKYSEAVEHYTAAVSSNVESRPFAAICFCNRAAAYQAIGQITDAIADCSLAIALDGDYPKAISRRATLHEMIRDYGKAAADLHRLVPLLEKQAEIKAKQAGKSGRPTSVPNDLRQARSRLSTMEEEARKEIPLNMYLILGIEPSGDASDVKKAYRKAALRYHPDKAGQFLARTDNGDDGSWKEIAEEVYKEADKLFKLIGEAYAILSDPAKRSRYDLEEEIRNSRKKANGSYSSPRQSNTNTTSSSHERRGSSRREWQDFWDSYQKSKWSEATRSRSRYY